MWRTALLQKSHQLDPVAINSIRVITRASHLLRRGSEDYNQKLVRNHPPTTLGSFPSLKVVKNTMELPIREDLWDFRRWRVWELHWLQTCWFWYTRIQHFSTFYSSYMAVQTSDRIHNRRFKLPSTIVPSQNSFGCDYLITGITLSINNLLMTCIVPGGRYLSWEYWRRSWTWSTYSMTFALLSSVGRTWLDDGTTKLEKDSSHLVAVKMYLPILEWLGMQKIVVSASCRGRLSTSMSMV